MSTRYSSVVHRPCGCYPTISLNTLTSHNRITTRHVTTASGYQPFLTNGIFCGVYSPKIANCQLQITAAFRCCISPQGKPTITSYTPNIPACKTFSHVWKELTLCFLNIITHCHLNTWGSALIPYPTLTYIHTHSLIQE